MGDLIAKTACADLLPLRIGRHVLEEVDLGELSLVMAYRGRDKSLLAAMQEAHGLAAPGPGRVTGQAGCRAIWFGKGQILLAGPPPGEGLAKVAAVSAQTDAWACVQISGPQVEDVLARLVPIDLRVQAFETGHTARSLIGHMNGSVTRLEADTFLLMVFRSMAATLVHDLTDAMETIAALR